MASSQVDRHITSKKMATVLFCAVAIIWLLVDRISKLACNGHAPGDVMLSNVLGLFEFKLAHNTGAAWSIMSNSTVLLGVFSVVVCAALAGYLFIARKGRAHIFEVLGLALVFAGGLGNAYDRFFYGHVVDFIHTTFMDFPVFNVADIGVTCGVVLFIAGSMIYLNESDEEGEDADA